MRGARSTSSPSSTAAARGDLYFSRASTAAASVCLAWWGYRPGAGGSCVVVGLGFAGPYPSDGAGYEWSASRPWPRWFAVGCLSSPLRTTTFFGLSLVRTTTSFGLPITELGWISVGSFCTME
jgi:hypothetical protein